jgi:hemerythrin-like domain-containing protein
VRQHRTLLDLLVQVERALRGRSRGAARRAAAATDALWAFTRLKAAHMRWEEEHLHPRLAASLPEVAPVLGDLRADHDEIRGLLEALTLRPCVRPGAAEEEQSRVLGRDLADLVRLHVEREERVAGPMAVRILAPGAWQGLFRSLPRLRAGARPEGGADLPPRPSSR